MAEPDNRAARCIAIAATARGLGIEPQDLQELTGLKQSIIIAMLRDPPSQQPPDLADLLTVERVIERLTLSMSIAERVRMLQLDAKRLEGLAHVSNASASRLLRSRPWPHLLSLQILHDIRRAVAAEESRRRLEPREIAVSIDSRGIDQDIESVRQKLGRLVGAHTLWVISTRYDGYLQASHLIVEESGHRFIARLYVPDDDSVGGSPPDQKTQSCYEFSGLVVVIGSAWYIFTEKSRPPHDLTCFVAALGDQHRTHWVGHLVNPIHAKNRTQGEAFCTTPINANSSTWQYARERGFFGYYKIDSYMNILNEIQRA